MSSLTLEQSNAVSRRDVSVALSAGAGCGKTHVLTERFLSHIDPTTGEAARLGQLIAITFTDAAAREMRSRIRKACYDRLQSPGLSELQQNEWLRLLRELDTARVSTIHAFCTSLLRAHAAEAGLDPTFDVLEQGEADVLRLNVMDDVLRNRLDQRDDDTLDLAATFTLARLKDQLATLIGRRHEPAFANWLAETDDDFAVNTDEMIAAWKWSHDSEAFQNCVREIAAGAPIDEIVEMLGGVEPEKPQFRDAKAELLDLLPKLKSGNIGLAEIERISKFARVRSLQGPYFCTAKDWGNSKEVCQRYGKLCESLRKCIDESNILPWNEAAAREAAELGLKLLRLANAVVAEYQHRKSARGKLDFDDQLALAHRLLADPKNMALRKELSADLQLLLVDEFQDTDPLQIELVKLICGEGFDQGRLFFVGDFKQSIYRFRGAQPPEFLRLRGEVPPAGQLPLTINFRSQPGILNFVNSLFRDEFSEYERLRPHRDSAADQPAVEFLWTITPDKNSGSRGAREAARRKEAERIARRLCDLLDPENEATLILDKETGEPRRVKPGDIAILFRALSDVRVCEEALRDEGLDYYLVGGHAFYAQQEIYDVLNLLRAVASNADEVSLAGVLRSPFFSLADETLFWLVESAGSLNAGLFAENLPTQLSNEEHAKVQAAAATIAHLRSIKDRVPIAALLNDALNRTGYDATLVSEFLGERKLANLQKLVEQARAADGAELDLNGFIVELTEFITRPPQEPLASTCQETAEVIRLMTIHRAKGLEFPVVVVPDLDRAPNFKGPIAALDMQLGPLVQPPLEGDDEKFETGMSLFIAREKVHELEERKRLLYVACTRAADYLILSSSLQSLDEPASDWMELIARRFNLATGEFLATLPKDYEAPAVFVGDEPEPNGAQNRRTRGPDLLKVLEQAHHLAEEGQGVVPRGVEVIRVNADARRQFSFSRLTGQIIRGDSPPSISPLVGGPLTEATPTVDPRGLGTLVHDLLARVNLSDPASIAEWAEHLAPGHIFQDAEEASRAAADLVTRFAASKRGRAIANSESAQHEVEFILAWPGDTAANNGSYLRGYIDCLYVNSDGQLILVDYKTDNIPPEAVPRAAERYVMQLYVYAMAAERALGEPPAKLVLHFLRPGTEHTFEWNDVARRKATEMVNDAIASERTQVQGSANRNDTYRRL
jgi:ATP-dependent helicase/nuclease subunit A